MSYDEYDYDYSGSSSLNGQKQKVTSSSAKFVGYVYLTMFIGLLITSIVAVGRAYLFAYLLSTSSNPDAVLTGLMITLIGSAIIQLVMAFVLPITFARGKHSILVPGIIYAIVMGVMLSTFVMFIDGSILAISVGATCLIFGLMSLIAFLGKGSLKGLSVALIGLLGGVVILSLINMIMFWISPETYNSLYWIVSFAFFAIIMIVTIIDMRRIKEIASRVEGTNNNLILYCGYCIYVDFIAILIRIIYYLSAAKSR